MTNGTSYCYDSVKVNVKMPTIVANAGPDVSVCPGQCTTLNGEATVIVSPAKNPTYENNQLTVVTGGTSTVNINITDLNQQQVLPGAIQSVCINGFTFSGTQFCTDFSGCNCNGTTIPMGQTCNLDISSFNVWLRSPNGCEILLVPQGEASGTSYPQLCFVPSGGQSITAANFPAAGNWNPQESLLGMDGCDANGVWSVEFDAPGGLGFGMGSFTGWSITFDDPEISYPGEFTWTPTTNMTGATTLTPNVCPDNTTTYTISVSDTAGCVTETDDVVVSIGSCCNFSISAVTTQPSCGLTNGAITITVLPSGNYSYAWSNSSTSQNLSNLGTGTYTLTVTDIAGNCTNDTTITLSNPSAPTLTLNATDASCGVSDGDITSTVTGGTGTITYLWSNGSTATNLTGLGAGSYSLTVTDANSCSAIASADISAPNAPVLVVSSNDALCGNNDGSASVSVSGGQTPYNYNWSNSQTTSSISGLAAGSYTVTVTDGASCTVTATANVSSIGGPTINITTNDASCGGNNGSATVTASGGTSPYTYLWSNSANTQTISSLIAGTYNVTVTDGSTCIATGTATINTTSPPSVTVSTNSVTCGYSSADATPTGGTAPYTFAWSNNMTGQSINGLVSGNYSVTVTDASGCTGTATFTVDPPDPLVATASITSNFNGFSVSCNGATDGSATVNAIGGTPPFSYLWESGETTQSLTGIGAGIYNVVVTDINNCYDTSTVTLTEPPGVGVTITTISDINCFNGSDGLIDISIAGGTLPYTYIWSNGANTEDLNNIPAGSYSVTITDANGCSTSANTSLNQPTAMTMTLTGTNIICNGQNNGSTSLTVSGGVEPYQYFWSNQQSAEDLNNLYAGIYSVTIQDANNCEVFGSISITEPSGIFLAPPESAVICKNTDHTLSAGASGGTPPYTFYWNGNSGGTTNIINISQNTAYSVYVVDAAGCSSNTSNITMGIVPDIFMNAYAYDDTICVGSSTQIHTNVTGGTGGPYYLYGNNNELITPPYTVTPLHTTSYVLTARDNCNNTARDTVTIYTESLPMAAFSSDVGGACVPFEVTFNYQGNEPGASYLWEFGEQQFISTAANPTHTYSIPGNYSVTLTITNSAGCSSSITNYNMISAYAIPTSSFMFSPNNASILNPMIQFSNLSEGANSYIWSFGDGDSSNVEHPLHPYQGKGQYTIMLIAITQHNCKDTSSQKLQIRDEYTFYAPSAISPDGNSLNDEFRVYGNGIDKSKFELFLYDRWGELVFNSKDIEKGWDGTYMSKKAQSGSYVWYVSYKDLSGVGHQVSGSVTLIR